VIALIILYYWKYQYKIISHCDGDTSWVKPLIGKKFKVRYAVIDANETRQAGGKEAKQYLTRILPVGSRVEITPTSTNKSYDRELIGTVYKGFIDINLAMLRAGYAVIDPRYLHQISADMQKQYINAENKAKIHRLGRWGDPSHYAQMPWEFRKKSMSRR
jgi:endonuclease YncB( thermonuclease family)